MKDAELEGSFVEAFSAIIEPSLGIVDVRFPLLVLDRAFSSKELAEKYPVRNLGVVPVTAARTFDMLEKFLLTDRDAGLAP